MLKIWGRANSINVQKVMWAVAELNLPHERIDAGGPFGGLDQPGYKALNPNSRVPTIDDNGVIVWESNAVVRYLAARYGAGKLWPIDPAQRSEADRWMDWQQTTIGPDMFPVFWGLIRTPPEKRDLGTIKAAADRLGNSWTMLDRLLADRPFVAGKELTMGDIPVGCAYWRYTKLDVAKPDLSHCDAWHRRLLERDGFRQHVAQPLS
ncbi:MAG: glutathione S-transferase family protein [Rhodospirillaceae bacterium]|nr:glutathione S-transferase family protein [Rhodospirillaceae bacterium]